MFQQKKTFTSGLNCLTKDGIEDEDRSERPTEVRSLEVIKSVNDFIQHNKRVTSG